LAASSSRLGNDSGRRTALTSPRRLGVSDFFFTFPQSSLYYKNLPTSKSCPASGLQTPRPSPAVSSRCTAQKGQLMFPSFFASLLRLALSLALSAGLVTLFFWRAASWATNYQLTTLDLQCFCGPVSPFCKVVLSTCIGSTYATDDCIPSTCFFLASLVQGCFA
jgi:hypothetical protein